ncbi:MULTISPECIES: endolytic transglycosylase MltG [Brevundimonas]|uniref:endolytic transglycosylase MltG n=1 Tax=Brevundimonas TaxID=41275 RepID=UPI000F036993|nr:endolytic transglycosylase MltG [Brevundimonas lutea]
MRPFWRRDRVERGRGPAGWLLGATATVSVFLIVALASLWIVYWGPGPSARDGDQTIVVLPSGAGVDAIGVRLHQAGVIRSTDLFKAAVALTGADRRIRAGEYEIPDRASLSGVIDMLVNGRVVRHFVTIPEGWSSAQAVDILNDEPVLTGEVADIPEEGSLWPETYEVTRGETRASVIRRMQQAQEENLAELWATARGPRSVVRTPEEALILASIVEKETGVQAERPRVAAVFSNRIRQGMRLESDPTVVYGVSQGRPLGRGLRLSELQADTPWNTYLNGGLPPTPIANPGREAIEAVLNPPASNEFFFVADGTGGHVFARTFDEHLVNVARWRQIEAERRAAGSGTEGAAPPAGLPGGPESVDETAGPVPSVENTGRARITLIEPGE